SFSRDWSSDVCSSDLDATFSATTKPGRRDPMTRSHSNQRRLLGPPRPARAPAELTSWQGLELTMQSTGARLPRPAVATSATERRSEARRVGVERLACA